MALATLALALLCAAAAPFHAASGAVTLNVAHVNDIHAHFEEVSEYVDRCKAEEAAAGECYGGMSRLYTKVQEMRDTEENFLLFNAGDYYSGTVWSDQFQFEPIIRFGNMLEYDAFCLGNHDFDDGIDVLIDFASGVNYPIVAANVIENPDGTTPVFSEYYNKSTIVEVGGARVGVIGYVTRDTPEISSGTPSTLDFISEVEALTEEARRLREEEGIEIIFALGHSGYDIDRIIAKEVADIDVVIGGHSHSFLYTGEAPSVETPEGEYPTYITQSSGKVVPVVQAFCYTKYLGHLELNFGDDGDLLEPVDGTGVSFADVVTLDSSIEQDEDIEEMLDEYREELDSYGYYDVLGATEVFLVDPEGEESNLGDILTDSMAMAWEDTTIAFINDGGIRSSIREGDITGEDVYYVLPFGNTVDRVTMTGAGMKAQIEEFMADLCPTADCYGTFLQMSGMRVVYDVYEDNQGSRVTSMETPCGDGTWCPIDMEEVYPVALVSFLAEGGTRKGKRSFDQWIITRVIGPVDNEVFSNYIRNFSPITQETEGRITINYHPGENAPEPPPPEEEDDDEDSGVSLRPSLGFLLAVMLRIWVWSDNM